MQGRAHALELTAGRRDGRGDREAVTEVVTVVLCGASELVTAGVRELVRPYPSRVELVTPRRPATPADPVDVALVDPVEPGPGGRQALVRARRLARAVVVYTWDPRPEHVATAYADGAAGFLPKSLSAAELVAALEAVRSGSGFVNLARPSALPAPPARGGPSVGRSVLTERESQVVALVAAGLGNGEIADRLYLSTNTVKSYIRSAYRRMDVHSRSQAVRWAFEHGVATTRGLPRGP